MTIDLSTTEQLAPLIPDDRIIISESGIGDTPDAVRVIDARADGILAGTAIMDAPFEQTKSPVNAFLLFSSRWFAVGSHRLKVHSAENHRSDRLVLVHREV